MNRLLHSSSNSVPPNACLSYFLPVFLVYWNYAFAFAFVIKFEEFLRRNVFSDLARDLPVQVDATTFDSPHTKSLLLLYAHLCRTPMPSTDYITDLKSVLDQAIRVLQVLVMV